MNSLALKPDSTARSAGSVRVKAESSAAVVHAPRSGWFSAEGSPLPFGQSWNDAEQAYNFSLYSENASGVTLLHYDERDATTPCFTLDLDPLVHKLREFWFCRVPKASAPAARYYAYSIRGPAPGSRAIPSAFDPDKVLLDPFARAVHFPAGFDREAARPKCREGSARGAAGRRAAVRLACRPTSATCRGRGRLRDARPRVHPGPE